MRKISLILLFSCCLILIPYLLLAQDGATISGKVTDVEGEPLPGANVLIQLTNLGAATDINGDYSFTVPASAVRGQEVKLEARFIGYRTKVEKITLSPGVNIVEFALPIDALEMDAIVVTGVVEETPRVKLAFSVGIVSAEALEQVTAISAESALRGKVAGVKIVRGSGKPGTDASVLLRAATSINANDRSQDPLYIVDGVIIDPSVSGSPLSDINTEDIANIEVVKGAAGASLYGSRAANGVVNITTNRGKGLALNQTRIRVRNEYGFNKLRKDYPLRKSHHYRIHEGTGNYTDENGITVTSGDFIDGKGNFVDPRQSGKRVLDRYTDNWDPDNPDEQNISQMAFADKPYKWVATGDIVLVDDPNDARYLLPKLGSSGQPVGLQLLPGGEPLNQIQQFHEPGTFMLNSVSLSRNMENTNFSIALSNRREDGVIAGLKGYERQTMRIAVDHAFRKNLSISISGFFSNVERDDIEVGVGSPFFGMVFTSGDVDLGARHVEAGTKTVYYNPTTGYPEGIPLDVGGELFIVPDPTSERQNAIYAPQEQLRKREQTRLMGGVSLDYRPVDWFKVGGNFSYDRSNREYNRFYHVGYQTAYESELILGRYIKYPAWDEAINANVTASFQKSFLSNELTIRSKVRALIERADLQNTYAEGTDLAVRGVQDLNVANSNMLDINSNVQAVRSEGYSLITGLDYKDRYIADFLVRRDGSSLFGPDERWKTYYRVSGAYRLSQESWWFTDQIQEFKLRGSFGTAGGRPSFLARYETWSVSDGAVSKNRLGNKALKPEYAKELELGVDMAFMDKFSLELTYAKSEVEDQLLDVPLVSYFGYSSQWQNAGTLSTNTFELNLQAALIRKRDTALSLGFILDRTRQKVTKLDLAPYNWAPNDSQGASVFRIQEGLAYGALWGSSSVMNNEELFEQIDNEAESQFPIDEFQHNDRGFLVWVGTGNTWRDGITKKLWGTETELLVGFDETTGDSLFEKFEWGMPINWEDEDGITSKQIGSTIPDFNWSAFANFEWKGFSVYGLLDSQVGGDLYSRTIQWGYSVEMNQAGADMTGVADAHKKPTVYWNRESQTANFIYDASYIKLRELSVKYSFKQDQLKGIFGGLFKKVSVGIIGRNLLTFDNYDEGYDPEVGTTGDQGGSAVVTKIDAFRYPNFRSFTGILEFEL